MREEIQAFEEAGASKLVGLLSNARTVQSGCLKESAVKECDIGQG